MFLTLDVVHILNLFSGIPFIDQHSVKLVLIGDVFNLFLFEPSAFSGGAINLEWRRPKSVNLHDQVLSQIEYYEVARTRLLNLWYYVLSGVCIYHLILMVFVLRVEFSYKKNKVYSNFIHSYTCIIIMYVNRFWKLSTLQ